MRLLLLAGLLRLVVALRVHRWSLRMGTGAGERKRLPVTVISGIQGAGKTTLLKHILDPDNRGYSSRYAVIVNDMSDGLHIDETLTLTAQEEMVQMNNGCVCCTLHDDLLLEVTRLALKGVYDHLIIESSGVSEPLSVAEALTFRTEDGETESLCDLVEIDTMVTVVDAASFIRDMAAAEELVDRGIAIDEGDTRTITDLLVAQVEFADVVIINKIDKVSVRQFNKVNQIVRSLNADAAILSSQNSKINLEEIFNARRFDFTRTAESPTWLQAINGDTKKQ
jgi:G3E family GTPase